MCTAPPILCPRFWVQYIQMLETAFFKYNKLNYLIYHMFYYISIYTLLFIITYFFSQIEAGYSVELLHAHELP